MVLIKTEVDDDRCTVHIEYAGDQVRDTVFERMEDAEFEYRTGSVHIDGDGATPLLYSQVIRICDIYDANARHR